MVEGDSSGEGGWPGHDLCVGGDPHLDTISRYELFTKQGGGGTNRKPTTYCCDSTNGLLPHVCGLLPGVHVGFYLGLRGLLVYASTE